ncbi:hypothetical protein STEG23_035709, partial [Scotinomys teguina]
IEVSTAECPPTKGLTAAPVMGSLNCLDGGIKTRISVGLRQRHSYTQKRTEEMAQWLIGKALTALPKDLGSIQYLDGSSELSIAPVPGNLIGSFGLLEHQTLGQTPRIALCFCSMTGMWCIPQLKARKRGNDFNFMNDV